MFLYRKKKEDLKMENGKIVLKVIDVVERTYEPTENVLMLNLRSTYDKVIPIELPFNNDESRTAFIDMTQEAIWKASNDCYRFGVRKGVIRSTVVFVTGMALWYVAVMANKQHKKNKQDKKSDI